MSMICWLSGVPPLLRPLDEIPYYAVGCVVI